MNCSPICEKDIGCDHRTLLYLTILLLRFFLHYFYTASNLLGLGFIFALQVIFIFISRLRYVFLLVYQSLIHPVVSIALPIIFTFLFCFYFLLFTIVNSICWKCRLWVLLLSYRPTSSSLVRLISLTCVYFMHVILYLCVNE